MTEPKAPGLIFDRPVALVGGGAFDWDTFHLASARAGAVVAADGGANWFRPEASLFDRRPQLAAVIGDMDSIEALGAWTALEGCVVAPIAEQDSTDLEKCLTTVDAPLFLGVGFFGDRLDHTLSAFHALLAHPQRPTILIGDADIAFLAPFTWRATLEVGARVSFMPLAPVAGVRSQGLQWPIDGLEMRLGGQIGASNRAVSAEVEAAFDTRSAAVILHRRYLDAAIESLIGPSLTGDAGGPDD